jgi:hypothetical protein
MAVMSAFQFQVMPGKGEEFQAVLADGIGIAMKNGAPASRVWQVTVGGPTTGTVVVTTEYESMAAYGAFVDKVAADPDWQALTGRMSTLAVVSVSVAQEPAG